MKPFFKNAEMQSQYDRDGYVVVDDMLSREHIDRLASLFKTIEPAGLNQMYVNIFDRSEQENMEIGKAIVEACSSGAERLLKDCNLQMGVFLAKGVGQQGACIMHQDWNSVDEEHYESLSIWCPLVDVDETNGCLYVVKGSHRMFHTIRTITIRGLALDFDDELEPFLTALPMKAGQAVIYAHNLFHGSKPTRSDRVRVAVGTGIFHNDARLLHYYHDSNNPGLVEVFEAPRDFYLKSISKYYDMKRPADLVKIGELHRNDCVLTKEEFFGTLRSKAVAVS